MTGTPISERRWAPLSIDEAREVFEPLGIRWWVAGGCALDLFLGETTRKHADVDISILRGECPSLAALLGGWELCIADDGKLFRWEGAPPAEEHHQFWARPRGAEAWAFEVLLAQHDADTWIYRRDARVRRPIEAFGRLTPGGVPYVAPEIALLYRAKRSEPDRNAADFGRALPRLPRDTRDWLRDALEIAHPRHPWIERL